MVKLKKYFFEILGSFIVAIGIYNFAVQATFPMTGFSGISIILYRLFNIPIGLSTVFLNIPLAILCFKLLGKNFFISSIRCMLLSSFFIDYVVIYLPVYSGDRLLAALCTGIFAGIGYALIYMQNSSTGGSDFIIMAVKAIKPHIPLGKITFLSDLLIVIIGGYIFQDIDGIIYGIIVSWLMSKIVDQMIYGANSGKFAVIITKKAIEITKVIDECSGRGSTILPAQGGYQQEDKQIVVCASNDKEMFTIQQKVKQTDPESFIVILESHEVHGNGFSIVQVAENEDANRK